MGSVDVEALGAPEGGVGGAGGSHAYQGGDGGGGRLPRSIERRKPKRESPEPLEEFDSVCLIGQGSAALVYLVRSSLTRKMSALKVQRKADHVRCAERVHMEREVMVDARHPLVAPLYSAFQDRMYLYLNMEYCPGGSLENFIRYFVKRTLTEDEARFYAAEITLGLEFLHSEGFVYRDLKAANVLVSASGHIKLTDFGIAERGKVKIETEDKMPADVSAAETPSLPRTRSSPGLRQGTRTVLKSPPRPLTDQVFSEPQLGAGAANAAVGCTGSAEDRHPHPSIPRTPPKSAAPSHWRSATVTGVCGRNAGLIATGEASQSASKTLVPEEVGKHEAAHESSPSPATFSSAIARRKQPPAGVVTETPPRPPTLRSRLRNRLLRSPRQPPKEAMYSTPPPTPSPPPSAGATASQAAGFGSPTASPVGDTPKGVLLSSASLHHKRKGCVGGDGRRRLDGGRGLPPSGAEVSLTRDVPRDRTRSPPSRARAASASKQTSVTLAEASWCLLAGSPEYMAPEVLMHAAQGSAVDWWGLGILTYELILGRTPFAGKGGKTRFTYLNIMHKEAEFPSGAGGDSEDGDVDAAVSEVCQDFIRALLTKDPRGRAGSRGTHAVKGHPFFESVQWEQLQVQEPPLLPRRLGVVGEEGDALPRPPIVENSSGWEWAAEDASGGLDGETDEEDGNTSVFDRFDWRDEDSEHDGLKARRSDAGLSRLEQEGLSRGDQFNGSDGAPVHVAVAAAAETPIRGLGAPPAALMTATTTGPAPVF